MGFKRDLVFVAAVAAVIVMLRILAAPLARPAAPEEYPGAGPVLLSAIDAGWSPAPPPAARTPATAPEADAADYSRGREVLR